MMGRAQRKGCLKQLNNPPIIRNYSLTMSFLLLHEANKFIDIKDEFCYENSSEKNSITENVNKI